MKIHLLGPAAIAFLTAFSTNASAQLTWEPVDIAGNDLWDTATDNWDSGGDNYVVWDNTGNTEAIFPAVFTADYTVTIVDGGVTVGDLTVETGSGKLQFASVTDNEGIIQIKTGGGTWDTGGGEIEFLNDLVNDTPLSIGSGDTLTVEGGGTFDTGEKPGGATWVAAGATLDVTAPTVVRGNTSSIGQFDLVKVVADSSVIQERNSNQTFANNFELTGSGYVHFGNRFGGRSIFVDGIVSGTAGLTARGLNSNNGGGGGFLRINNPANTFTGGLLVDGSVNNTMVIALADDGVFGAVPASFDADNITLKDGGRLRLQGGVNINANRGVTLENGGVIILNGNDNTLNAPITGTGDLSIGVEQDGSSNTLHLTVAGSDYTGDTNIVRGNLSPSVDNALPAGAVLRLGNNAGGGTTSRFLLNGTDQTVAGLQSTGNNTKEIRNNGVEDSTITVNVPDGESSSYASNFGPSDAAIHLVKDGLGFQGFNRVSGYTFQPGDITVNAGTLNWNVQDSYGAVTVNSGGTFIIGQTGTSPSFTSAAGSTTTYNVRFTDWNGPAGTGWPLLTVTGDLNAASGAAFDVVVSDNMLVNFTNADASFLIATVGGTLLADPADFTLDATGFTAGNGTWELAVDGNDLLLEYTAGTGSAYDTWAAMFPGLGGFEDDDDMDGRTNGEEWYFGGTNPVDEGDGSPLTGLVSTGSGTFEFTHLRPVDTSGATAEYEWSTVLDGGWNASGATDGGFTVTLSPGTPVAADPGYEEVTVTVTAAPTTLEKLFARLSVTMP